MVVGEVGEPVADAPERPVEKPRISPIFYVNSQFTTAKEAECFVTNGRLILAFDRKLGWPKQVPVLDTFYGMEIMLAWTGEAVTPLRKVLNAVQVEEDCSLRRATFLLLSLSQAGLPHLQLMAVDFGLKSFEIRRDLPLHFGRHSVASAGRILRAGGGRFVVVVSHRQQHWAIAYDHAEQTARACHQPSVPIVGEFFDFQLRTNQLVCLHTVNLCIRTAKTAVHLLLVDLESGAHTEVKKNPDFMIRIAAFMKGTCMAGDFLYVFAKSAPHCPYRAFRLRLPDGEWEAVKSAPFSHADLGYPLQCVQQGVWSLHCRRKTTSGGLVVDEFRSYRIPMTCPEPLALRSWFAVLGQAGVEVDVPESGPCSPLAPTGLCLNRVFFLQKEKILIRADVDAWDILLKREHSPSDCVLPAVTQQSEWSNTMEYDALQDAIEASFRTLKIESAAAAASSGERNSNVESEQADERKPAEAEVDIKFDDYNYGESDFDGTDDEAERGQRKEQEEKKEAELDAFSVATASTMRIDDYMENADDTADWEFVRHS